jgi:hypothetical protein
MRIASGLLISSSKINNYMEMSSAQEPLEDLGTITAPHSAPLLQAVRPPQYHLLQDLGCVSVVVPYLLPPLG